MTKQQERILAGLSIAISLAAIGVSIRTERTLDALEAMRSASTLGNSRSDPMRAIVPGSLRVLDDTPDLIHGIDTLTDSAGRFIDPADSGYVAGSTVWINGKLYFKEGHP